MSTEPTWITTEEILVTPRGEYTVRLNDNGAGYRAFVNRSRVDGGFMSILTFGSLDECRRQCELEDSQVEYKADVARLVATERVPMSAILRELPDAGEVLEPVYGEQS